MWLGRSWPSCTMSSARSVSQAAIPASSRASLRSISWVAIDLTLTTSSEPVARMRSMMMRLASSASRAQCTVEPALVRFSSSWTSQVSRWRATRFLTASPAERRSCQWSSSATTRCRFVRMVWVAWRRLARWVSLPSSRIAACGNGGLSMSAPSGGAGVSRTLVGMPRLVVVIGPSPRSWRMPWSAVRAC